MEFNDIMIVKELMKAQSNLIDRGEITYVTR